MKNKFRRSQERKEARDAEKFKASQKKDIEKPNKPKPKWRKLNDGGIAFGDKFKIGRGGQIGFGVIGAMVLFFVVGLTLYPIESQEGGQCANPFCEWIDVIFQTDNYGAKQTPKEQVPLEDRDFLPPVKEPAGFLFPLILPEAEARGDDEPVCYSPACKAKHKEVTDHFDSEEEQAKSINEQIIDMKEKIRKTEDVIKLIEEAIREYKIEIPVDQMELLTYAKDVEDQAELVKDMRYIYDRMRYEYTDVEAYLEYEEEYKNELKELEDLEFKHDKLENDITRDLELLDKEEEFLKLAEVDYMMFIEELDQFKISLHKIHRAGNLFSIVLSNTCNTLIEQEINTREVIVDIRDNYVYETETEQICPTYRQLKDTFDNTLEPISGYFVDHGYDIRRDVSGYDDYWRYYYNMPFWRVITVDPDVDMLYRSMVIEVQANEFRYATNHDNSLTHTIFENGTHVERSYNVYENVSIDENCRRASVAPDIELIGKVLQYFIDECEGDLDYHMQSRVIMPYLAFDKFESQYYKYLQWLNDAIRQYGPQ